MAENKSTSESKSTSTSENTSESTSKTTTTKIEVVGPADPSNGTSILRFNKDAESKGYIDILPGQTLSVGGQSGDLTKAEAERLLGYSRWEFKEVKG